MKKLDQLTFTRFIAAFAVLLFHGGTQVFPFGTFPINPLLTSGQTAVSYFYVLSGFVMALVYYRPQKRFDFRSYWTARFSRIYPVYILAFVLTCVYYIDIMSRAKSGKIWANVFLYQAWIPTYSQSYNMAAWSLSVEAFFYVIFPLLAIALRNWPVRRVIGLSIGFWVVSNVVHSLLYARMMPEAHLLLDYFPLFHFNAFLLGMAGGVWYLAQAPRLEVKPVQNWSLLLVALALLSLALIGRKLMPAIFRGMSLDVGLLAPFFLVVVLTLALDRSRLSAWMSQPGAVLLGDASYALYILHVPVRWLTERALALMGIDVAFPVMYAVYMPLMILLSVAVFVFIERPARDWLREHMDRLALILLDLVMVAGAVWASFALRLGARAADFSRSELFTFRSALVLYFLALVLCGVYRSRKPAWGVLFAATVLGSGGLMALSYLGWISGWVEGFPRSVLLLQAGLTFMFLLASRFALRLWRPGARLAEKQA